VIEAASAILTHSKSYLSFSISQLSVRREREMLEHLSDQDVDGLVYYPWTSDIPAEILDRFVRKNKPVVLLDKKFDDDRISSGVCDNYRGGYMLTEHLISYGHKRTCYLSRFEPETLSSIRDRYAGYTDCLAESSAEPPRFVHWATDVQPEYPMLKHTVNNLYLDGVTAILCENDEVAFNVYLCCRSLNIRVPDEMNITGFDNIEWATTGSAQITTIDQNFTLIGEALANLILKEDYTPAQLTLPVRLIPRTSTGLIVSNA
jgi:DNA-binding LacI/PurR family transcriptional regulator